MTRVVAGSSAAIAAAQAHPDRSLPTCGRAIAMTVREAAKPSTRNSPELSMKSGVT